MQRFHLGKKISNNRTAKLAANKIRRRRRRRRRLFSHKTHHNINKCRFNNPLICVMARSTEKP